MFSIRPMHYRGILGCSKKAHTLHQKSFKELSLHGPQLKVTAFFSVSTDTDLKPDFPHNIKSHSISANVKATDTFANRMWEVLANSFSKLFFGGAAWQAGSQYPSDILGFALTTGVSDALGVACGSYGFNLVKYAIVRFANQYAGKEWVLPNLRNEISTSILLGSASAMSGTVWQPVVDFLKTQTPDFIPIAAGTGLACGSMFFVGLQASRYIYPASLGIEKSNQQNRRSDFLLAMLGISGAAAAFVFTDVSIESNPLKKLFGTDRSFFENVERAGASTATGFFVLQALLYFMTMKVIPSIKTVSRVIKPITPGSKLVTGSKDSLFNPKSSVNSEMAKAIKESAPSFPIKNTP